MLDDSSSALIPMSQPTPRSTESINNVATNHSTTAATNIPTSTTQVAATNIPPSTQVATAPSTQVATAPCYEKVYGKLKIGITVATYLDFKLCIGMVRCAGKLIKL